MSKTRSLVAAATLVAASVVLGASSPAHAIPTWAPAATATIKPGVQTITGGGQCTSSFVFYDSSNNIYLGQSAHCASTSGATVTNGCIAGSLPLNTNVTVRGASKPGKLVYSSWLTMQSPSTTPAPTSTECAYNDFALVKLDPADYNKVNPSIPFWGGPVGINTTGQNSLRDVHSYGNSGLRLGIAALSPKQGVTSTFTNGTHWNIRVYTASPGIPGDSGSAFLDEQGRAFGSLSTLSVDGSNGVANINLALNYLKAHSSFTTLQLALGTQPFTPIV